MSRSFSLAGLLRVRSIQERAAAQELSRAVIEADADETEAAALTAAGLETLRAGRAVAPRTELP